MAEDVASLLQSGGDLALNVMLIIISIIIVLGIILGVGLLIIRWKRYQQFKCVIWERDGFGQLKESFDQAGIFVDKKTKNKRLFLKKNKVGLNPDQIPYLQSKKAKTLYFLKTGLKNFRYIKIDIDDPFVKTIVGEEDVNWSINAYERQKKIFQQGLLMQLMPFILVAFVSIIILIIFIYFFREFDTLVKMAEAMERAAGIWAQAQGGTVVLN